MAYKKPILLLFTALAFAVFINYCDSSLFTEQSTKLACKAAFYVNYTSAMAVYGTKVKVGINQFYVSSYDSLSLSFFLSLSLSLSLFLFLSFSFSIFLIVCLRTISNKFQSLMNEKILF